MRPSRRSIIAVVAGIALALTGGGIALAASISQAPPIACPAGQPIVLYPGESGDSGAWACTTLPTATTIVSPSPSPYPSPSPVVTTVTDTVTVTASASSTSPSPTPSSSPTATTPAPTTTTPSPSTTPTPTSSSTPAGGCMPKPSACGWPDATNTGVPAGVQLRSQSGDLTITKAGTVIDGLDLRGCVSVRATNVVIRNSRITCGSWYAIGVQAGTGSDSWVAPDANLLVENVEIVMSSMDMKGIAFDGYTARRVWFHGGSDCAHFGRNVTVEDSFCDIPAGRNIGSAHIDGFQSDGGRNIVLRHNTIRVPYSQTSAILMSTNTSRISDVSIVDNLMAGGGYTVYCATDSGGPVRGELTFTGNRIAKTYFGRGGYWGPTVGCPPSGWTWDA